MARCVLQNWDGVVSLLMLERLAGLSYSVLDAESVFVVRDWLPPSWDYVEVSVPVKGTWVDVSITRTADKKGKIVTVKNNPLKQ